MVAIVAERADESSSDKSEDRLIVVGLPGEDHAVAARMPSDEDIMAPRKVFWQHEGPAHDVRGTPLGLPDDRKPGSTQTCR